jgi:hypothetical protein
VKEDPFGVELAEISLTPDRLAAVGVAIGTDPVPYRLDYTLETERDFVTERLQVTTRAQGWRRTLDLRREPSGVWSAATTADGEAPFPPGNGDIAQVGRALDCDLGLSPLTNSMPVLRHGLLDGGGPVDFEMAWVSVPDLSVRRSAQRYTFVRSESDRHIVRFETTDEPFVADLVFDDAGVVLDYPGLARRLPYLRTSGW